MHLKLNMTPPTEITLGLYVFQQSHGGEIYAAWLLHSGGNIMERKIFTQLVRLFPYFLPVKYVHNCYT
jgi:hypothetical protein